MSSSESSEDDSKFKEAANNEFACRIKGKLI